MIYIIFFALITSESIWPLYKFFVFTFTSTNFCDEVKSLFISNLCDFTQIRVSSKDMNFYAVKAVHFLRKFLKVHRALNIICSSLLEAFISSIFNIPIIRCLSMGVNVLGAFIFSRIGNAEMILLQKRMLN